MKTAIVCISFLISRRFPQKKKKNVRIAIGWVAGWRVYMNERYKCAQVNRCAAFHVSERNEFISAGFVQPLGERARTN